MDAFKITFGFSSPVVIDSEYPLHLDALIAAMVAKEAQDMGAENAWEVADDLSGILDRTHGDDWVWKASRLVFTPANGIMFHNMIRKSDPDRYYRDLGRYWMGARVSSAKPLGVKPETFAINTGSGQLRGYQWLAASQWMKHAVAYGVGDIDAVRHYMGMLTHVGKMGRNGYGRICSIDVQPASVEEAEYWRLRFLPSGVDGVAGIEYADVTACLRAPYWRKTSRQVVQEPII